MISNVLWVIKETCRSPMFYFVLLLCSGLSVFLMLFALSIYNDETHNLCHNNMIIAIGALGSFVLMTVGVIKGCIAIIECRRLE